MRTRMTVAAAALLAADDKAPAPLTEDQAAKVAEDADIFGYPLVLMNVTKTISTAVPKPEGTKTPINQFANVRAFPDATFTDVFSPNADTLYSLAWLEQGASGECPPRGIGVPCSVLRRSKYSSESGEPRSGASLGLDEPHEDDEGHGEVPRNRGQVRPGDTQPDAVHQLRRYANNPAGVCPGEHPPRPGERVRVADDAPRPGHHEPELQDRRAAAAGGPHDRLGKPGGGQDQG